MHPNKAHRKISDLIALAKLTADEREDAVDALKALAQFVGQSQQLQEQLEIAQARVLELEALPVHVEKKTEENV